MGIAEVLSEWILQRPSLLREASLAFNIPPARQFGNTTILLGHQQVTDVLSRHTDFHLADRMRPRLPAGPFLLSTEPPGIYATDKAAMCQAIYPADNQLTDIIRLETETRAKAVLKGKNHIDAVGGLLEIVAADVAQQTIIGPDSSKHADPGLIEELRTLAELIVAAELTKDLEKRGIAATHAVQQRVSRRLKEPISKDNKDMTAQLKVGGMDNESIGRLVTGMAATATATIARAGGQALNELLHRPAHLKEAVEFAQDGNKIMVLQYMMEALRFNPMFSFIGRKAVSDTSISVGSSNIYLKRDSEVLVGLLPAMLDSSIFPEPRRFMVNRPIESYLHFGYGVHRCFGGPIALIQFEEIFTSLLQQGEFGEIRRDKRLLKSGYLDYKWPALRHLCIRWDKP